MYLRELYLDPDTPPALRAKCAIGALPHEVARLLPEKAAIDAACEEIYEPLADIIARQRARCDAMEREARDIEVLPNGTVRVLPKPGSNGSDN